ncbi:putative glycosyltransferase sugar-binding protein containing DXd motif [Fadolivirus algeromassiliense]|jgi:mannosyltransferase OCH1-like enzyme|uniref:Glycosyltransferase sugar-binding protein containing DXd motif n=1 Tax=Fadolivirus FV1/VV64 TaxID=3070911 RepID=A0A7D3QVW7_9VIRU|nr:putative glycosyltransferase sugar-binding protein containing DXd motif [Fadolivirus algeromassiliense]QKF94066.1 putative glycosyltransferase sugar-binding protein containing DXd motif [Fadolivirus FV1/VV64]
MTFPKIIHQIWFQGIDLIPQELLINSKKIFDYHPSYQYIVWDDDKINQYFKDNDKILKTYNKLKHLHQKVDFIRYCLLYELGGIYVDMDVTILQSFDDIINKYNEYECIISTINLNTLESYGLCFNKICLNNGVIISKPKSEFLLNLINSIHDNTKCKYYDLNKSICINRTTGPLLFTKVFNNYHNKQKIKVLDWSYFEPCILGDLCDIKNNTILIHHHNTTWINKFFTTIGYYYFKYRIFVYLLLIIIVIQMTYYFISYIKK